jgi:hypothetical protein
MICVYWFTGLSVNSGVAAAAFFYKYIFVEKSATLSHPKSRQIPFEECTRPGAINEVKTQTEIHVQSLHGHRRVHTPRPKKEEAFLSLHARTKGNKSACFKNRFLS